ncbi:MAG TPA: FliM/FliN family flagellar motor switch protein [Paucimonas sp.]|nr:FliM/FliN family flagellar motor switch protein [Paucimonas sp.]
MGDTCLSRLSERLTQTLQAWCAAWGLSRAELHIQCARAWDSPTQVPRTTWLRLGTERKSIWLAWPSDVNKGVQRLMFRSDERPRMESDAAPLASGGVAFALKALTDRIAADLSVDGVSREESCTPEKRLFQRGSGAVSATIKLGDQTLFCLFDHGVVHAVAERPAIRQPGIVPVKLNEAVRGVRVSLPVVVGQVEVDIGSLLTLSVGDVIRLDTQVYQPAIVSNEAGTRLFGGYLGASEGELALEVIH